MSMADKEEEELAVKAEEEKELPRPPLVGRRDIRPLELRVKSEPMPDLEVLHNFGSSLDSNISVLRSPENARQRFLRRAVSESVGTTSSPAGDRDAASQIRRERGFSFEEPVQFLEPLEGTPAYMALEANKNIKMNAVNKLINKSMSFGGIRPKLKNLKKLNLTGKKKYRRFSRNFKGNVIDGVHELYTLTAGMMLGIRCAVIL